MCIFLFSSIYIKLLFNQVPALQINEMILPQSKSIERFLSKQFGLLGNGILEEAQIDAINEGVEDLFNKYRPIRYLSDKDEKVQKFQALQSDVLPVWLANFEKILGNNKQNGVLFGKTISLADLNLFYLIENFFEEKFENFLDKFPLISSHFKEIQTILKR